MAAYYEIRRREDCWQGLQATENAKDSAALRADFWFVHNDT